MESSLIQALKVALENGWRVGVIFLIAGGLVLTAHHFSWPEPKALDSVIGYAALSLFAGIAVVVSSLLSNLADLISRRKERAQARKDNVRARDLEYAGVLENVETLIPSEAVFLRDELQRDTIRKRFELPHRSREITLIDKKLLTIVDRTSGAFICSLHPAVLKNKNEVLQALINRLSGMPERRD